MKIILAVLLIAFTCAFAKVQVEWIVKHDLSINNGVADILVLMSNDGKLDELQHEGKSLEDLDWKTKGRVVVAHKMQIAEEQQKEVLAMAKKQGLKAKSYWVTNCVAIYGATEKFIEILAERNDIRLIMTNREFKVPLLPEEQEDVRATDKKENVEWNVKWIKADKVWEQGYEGKGIITGNADTGIMYEHEALVKNYKGNKKDGKFKHDYHWFDGLKDMTNCGTCKCGVENPCDDQGHGTHCMGTTSGGVARKIGVAPKSKWIGCRAFSDRARKASPATFLNCLQFFAAPSKLDGSKPNPDKRPHTTSHSYGCPSFYCPNSEFLKEAAETLKKEGVFMIVSAGNSGPRCSTVNRPPGHMGNVFSVGASGTNSNTIASFSSRGPITLDGSKRMKPEITAPGVGVWSSVIGNRYASYSGTSMASPAVNGAVALIWNAVPALKRKVDATIKIIQDTATKVPVSNTCESNGSPNNVYGHGVIDVEKAVAAAKKLYGNK
eukprot:gene2241-2415_t